MEREKGKGSEDEYQQVEEDRGGGVRRCGKARWRADRENKRSSWADRSRAVRRRVGLPARETVCGFEEVDRLCVYASCYVDSGCSNIVVVVGLVFLVREIISQELVRGPYI